MRVIYDVSFRILVLIHTVLCVVNIAAIFVLPFYQPWYVAVPVITYLGNLMLTPVSCPLTRLENRIRKKLNKPEIKQFVGHYFFSPVRKVWRRLRLAYQLLP